MTGGDETRTCTSAAPASKSICTICARRVAAHDRVVDDDEALAGHLGERVELQADALLAQLLVGLDERAADVAVLDQALAERDPERAREPDRGGRAGVGDRQHEVGVDRRLLREPLAHAHARAVHLDAVEPRVRPREVEELEDAERARGRRLDGLHGAHAVVVDDHDLAGLDLAHEAPRRRGRARTSRRRRPSRRRCGRARAGGSRAGRGRRRACPRRARRSSTRPRACCIALATASSSGISVVRDERGDHLAVGGACSVTPSARSSSRSASAFTRLPLWPSATVRARPCWTSGCAFAHCDDPVVE